jgi:phage terminase small subunit
VVEDVHVLTDKQRLFVEAYLIEPNGKKAAIAAGYSPSTAEVQASRLLRHVQVAEALQAGRKLASVRSGITPEMVLAELGKIAFSDIRRVVKWMSEVRQLMEDPETGEPTLEIANRIVVEDSDSLDPATAGAISEVSMTKSGTLKVKLYDKRAALVDLGRATGIFDKAPKKPAAGGKKAGQAGDQPPAGDQEPAGDWGGLLN